MSRPLFVQRRAGNRTDFCRARSKWRAHLRYVARFYGVMRRRGWADDQIDGALPLPPCGLPLGYGTTANDRYAPGAAMNRCRWFADFRRRYGFYPIRDRVEKARLL